MSFLVSCPNCGPRSAYEYRFGGEMNRRPTGPLADAEWSMYLYNRRNVQGEQVEWWYHRLGCRKWFLARRHTQTNHVIETYWPEVRRAPAAAEASPDAGANQV